MATLGFFVPGLPIAQPRHKSGRKKTRFGLPGKPIHYLPADHQVHAWKRTIRLFASQSAARHSWKASDQALHVSLKFVLPRPEKPKGAYPTGRPDSDNLEKAFYDAVKAILWDDDSRICVSLTKKVYQSAADEVGVYVFISHLEE